MAPSSNDGWLVCYGVVGFGLFKRRASGFVISGGVSGTLMIVVSLSSIESVARETSWTSEDAGGDDPDCGTNGRNAVVEKNRDCRFFGLAEPDVVPWVKDQSPDHRLDLSADVLDGLKVPYVIDIASTDAPGPPAGRCGGEVALTLCLLVGVAVIVHYDLNGGGWRYQIYQKKRAVRTVGPIWETAEQDDDIWEMLNATVDDVETRLFGEEFVCVNYPLMAAVLHRVPEAEFAVGAISQRARLIRLAETVDRLISDDQPQAAAKLLQELGNQLESALIRPSLYIVRRIIETRLEGLNSAPFA